MERQIILNSLIWPKSFVPTNDDIELFDWLHTVEMMGKAKASVYPDTNTFSEYYLIEFSDPEDLLYVKLRFKL